MRPSLLATAAVLCALWACSLYPAPGVDLQPSPACVTACGVTFAGQDCAGFVQLEQRVVRAFGECDAGSPETFCQQLGRLPYTGQGWVVSVLPASQTRVEDGGLRYWLPTSATAAQAQLEHVDRIRGQTDCRSQPPSVTLADEAWWEGSAAVELIHVGALECDGNPYPAWKTNGRLCVKQRVIAGYRDGGS